MVVISKSIVKVPKLGKFGPGGVWTHDLRIRSTDTLPRPAREQVRVIGHFRYIKILSGSEAWGNKTKEINYSSLDLVVISFVLFPQASEPS